jgi:hypothetical protein
MDKFLSIPVTGQANQLVSASNVVLVEGGSDSATATTTVITYAGGKFVTLTHAAQVAYSMRTAIQNAIVAANQQAWYNVVLAVTVPQAVSDIDVA